MKNLKILLILFVLISSSSMLFAEEITEKAPVFKETTNDAVLLRYKYAKGDAYTLFTANLVEMDMKSPDQDMSISMTMNFTIDNKITEVGDGGIATNEVTITRIFMTVIGPYSMTLDTDNLEDLEKNEFKDVTLLVDKPFYMDTTETGAIVSVDADSIIAEMEKGDSTAGEDFVKNLKEMTKSSYVSLPEKPVKAGDIYDGGTVEQNMQGVGMMTVSMQYEVLSISKDKKQAVLKPMGEFSSEELNLQGNDIKGWILFDIEKGLILKSYVVIKMNMEIMGMKVDSMATAKYSIE